MFSSCARVLVLAINFHSLRLRLALASRPCRGDILFPFYWPCELIQVTSVWYALFVDGGALQLQNITGLLHVLRHRRYYRYWCFILLLLDGIVLAGRNRFSDVVSFFQFNLVTQYFFLATRSQASL